MFHITEKYKEIDFLITMTYLIKIKIKILNSLRISAYEGAVVKILPANKSLKTDRFSTEFYQIFNKN